MQSYVIKMRSEISFSPPILQVGCSWLLFLCPWSLHMQIIWNWSQLNLLLHNLLCNGSTQSVKMLHFWQAGIHKLDLIFIKNHHLMSFNYVEKHLNMIDQIRQLIDMRFGMVRVGGVGSGWGFLHISWLLWAYVDNFVKIHQEMNKIWRFEVDMIDQMR